MKSDRKQTILFIIILLVMSMGVGYAFLTTTLSIDGVSDIDSAVWDIHFDNLELYDYNIVTGDQVITPATIGANGTSISFHIKLNEPGDGYGFDVDVVNAGTLDAVIDTVTFQINGVDSDSFPSYLGGGIRYTFGDETPVGPGDVVTAGSSSKYNLEIYYKYFELTPDILPSSNQSLEMTFNITYKQAGKRKYMYSFDEFYYLTGKKLPDYVTLYDNYQDSINSFGHNAFIRYVTIGRAAIERSLGFIYDGNVHYLDYSSSSCEESKTYITNLFGSENCGNNASNYYCVDSDYTFEVNVYNNCNLRVIYFDDDQGCVIANSGSGCGDIGM